MSLCDGILGLVPEYPIPVRSVYRAIRGEPAWAIDAALIRLVREGKLIRVLDQIHLPGNPAPRAPLENERCCKSCGNYLPIDQFRSPSGRAYHTCKSCISLPRAAAVERRRAGRAGFKKCRTCGRWLSIKEHFALHTSPKLAGQRWTKCYDCRRKAREAKMAAKIADAPRG